MLRLGKVYIRPNALIGMAGQFTNFKKRGFFTLRSFISSPDRERAPYNYDEGRDYQYNPGSSQPNISPMIAHISEVEFRQRLNPSRKWGPGDHRHRRSPSRYLYMMIGVEGTFLTILLRFV